MWRASIVATRRSSLLGNKSSLLKNVRFFPDSPLTSDVRCPIGTWRSAAPVALDRYPRGTTGHVAFHSARRPEPIRTAIIPILKTRRWLSLARHFPYWCVAGWKTTCARIKGWRRLWNWRRRLIVSRIRHQTPPAQPPDAKLSAPALHLPTPRATG